MGRVKFITLLFLCGFGFSAAAEHLSLCYVPGAGHANTNGWVFRDVPAILATKNVPFLALDVGPRDTVARRATYLRQQFEAAIVRDPELRCHFLAYSMGGLIIRYALAYEQVEHPTLGRVPFKSLAKTITTFSSPHGGTPLAKYPDYYHLDSGMEALTERGAEAFTEYRHPGLSLGLPAYSYRTFMRNENSFSHPGEQLGYGIIRNEYTALGLDPRSDGIIPLISQGWGKVLNDFPMPHSYFSDAGNRTDVPATEVYEIHWHFLNRTLDEIPDPPADPRLRARTGILRELLRKLRQATSE